MYQLYTKLWKGAARAQADVRGGALDEAALLRAMSGRGRRGGVAAAGSTRGVRGARDEKLADPARPADRGDLVRCRALSTRYTGDEYARSIYDD